MRPRIMNLLRTSLMVLAICFMATSCSKDEPATETDTNYSVDLGLANKTDWQMANEILTIINEHRDGLHLDPIVMDKKMATAYAVLHTQYMMDQDELSHDNYALRSQALIENGAAKVGENVALGYLTAAQVVNAWLHSPSHKRVIEGNYTHSGFGVMQDERGTYYFTQLFYLE